MNIDDDSIFNKEFTSDEIFEMMMNQNFDDNIYEIHPNKFGSNGAVNFKFKSKFANIFNIERLLDLFYEHKLMKLMKL